jgi:branched-chain amino acid transport system permease protein
MMQSPNTDFSMMKLLKAAWPVIALVIPLALIVFLATSTGTIGFQRTVTEALIRIVMVVGLYIFVGNSGLISFGHMTFSALAAYAVTWQTCCSYIKPVTMPGLPDFLRDNTIPLLPAAVIAIVFAGLAAFLVGVVLMRLSGLAASIATLAILFVFNSVFSNWNSVTLGRSPIVGIPTYVTPWVAFGAATLAIVVAYLYQRSKHGLALRATREDEVAAAASGVSLYWKRLGAFVVSGCVMGLAGVMFVHFLGTISVSSFYINLTFITLAMLVVGGMRSLAGAVVGVVVISSIIDIFRQFESGVTLVGVEFSVPSGTQEIILAVLMLVILVWRKDGLMGGREIPFPFRSKSTSKVQ